MKKDELIERLTNFYQDSRRLAEKEKRCLEDKDEKAYKEICKKLA